MHLRPGLLLLAAEQRNQGHTGHLHDLRPDRQCRRRGMRQRVAGRVAETSKSKHEMDVIQVIQHNLVYYVHVLCHFL